MVVQGTGRHAFSPFRCAWPSEAGPNLDRAAGRGDQAGSEGTVRGAERGAVRAAGLDVGRADALGPDGPAGAGCGREGRLDQARVRRSQSARGAGDVVRRADDGGEAARLSLADPPARAGRGRGRDLQSIALRGRAGGAGEEARDAVDLERALRVDQRLRAGARRRRVHSAQVLPAHHRGRAGEAASGAREGSERRVEVERRGLEGARTVGRVHRRV